MSDKKNIKQFLRGILDKYSDNTLKAKDVVPDFISQKIGQSFSNAKLPAVTYVRTLPRRSSG